MALAAFRRSSVGFASLVSALVLAGGCNRGKEAPATAASAHSVALPTVAAPSSPAGQKAEPSAQPVRPDSPLLAKAKELTHKYIVLDGHVDVPWRLDESRDADGSISEDVSH